MPHLQQITLCCVDTNTGGLGGTALTRSLNRFPAKHALLFTPTRPLQLDPRIQWVALPRFRSVAEYSRFMLCGLHNHIKTKHFLVLQWDGFIIDGKQWDDAFLNYDYIGAVWPQFKSRRQVGNGGFSLRSQRLLEALKDPDMVLHHPEDLSICHTNRALLEDRYSIRFAPPEVAARFSYEREEPVGPTFGFHGLFNFPRALPATYADELIRLPASLLCNRDAIDLGIALRRKGSAADYRILRRILLSVALKRPQALLPLIYSWEIFKIFSRKSTK